MSSDEFMIKSLDPYINVQELEKLHLEICHGIAKSVTNMSSRVIPHLEMSGDLSKLFDYKISEQARIAAVADEGMELLKTEEEKEIFQKLNHEQKKRFLQLYKKAYWDGEFVRIKFTRKEFLQHPYATFHDSMTEWHPNVEHFPGLKSFIQKLPFREVGRILFFVSYHYLHSDVHYDRKDEVFDGRHHFIWFNPFQQKKFFLLDDNKVPHYLDCKAAFFNTRFLHGAAPSDRMTYSFRVDGQLEEDFCRKVGILWKKR